MSEEQTPQETPQSSNSFQQQDPFPPQNGGIGFNGMQQTLPNATIVLVLGILSILTCCCFYGIIGLVLSIVALVLSKKDRQMYQMNLGAYTESSFKNLNAGRVCAIIGLILNILILLVSVIFIAVFGWAAITDQEALKEILQNMQ